MENVHGYAVVVDGQLSLPAFYSKDQARDHAAGMLRRLLAEDGMVIPPIEIVPVLIKIAEAMGAER